MTAVNVRGMFPSHMSVFDLPKPIAELDDENKDNSDDKNDKNDKNDKDDKAGKDGKGK